MQSTIVCNSSDILGRFRYWSCDTCHNRGMNAPPPHPDACHSPHRLLRIPKFPPRRRPNTLVGFQRCSSSALRIPFPNPPQKVRCIQDVSHNNRQPNSLHPRICSRRLRSSPHRRTRYKLEHAPYTIVLTRTAKPERLADGASSRSRLPADQYGA
jgi:hypothetical protein